MDTIREMTPMERAEFLDSRREHLAAGEPVVDLQKFHPRVQVEDSGQRWIVYERITAQLQR